MLFEEFLEEEVSAGRAKLPLGPGGPERIVLHGHCHQRSLGLVSPALSLLRRIPGGFRYRPGRGLLRYGRLFWVWPRPLRPSLRPSGNAGCSPTARNLDSGSVLVAAGVSCRHQVRDFTGVRALHPAELIVF